MIDSKNVFTDLKDIKKESNNLNEELLKKYKEEYKLLNDKLNECEEEEKEELMKKINNLDNEYEECKESLEELNDTIDLEDTGINISPTLNEAINDVKGRLAMGQDPEKANKILEELNDTLTLNRIKNKILTKSRNDLKKNYKVWLPKAYEKLDKSKSWFPNIRKMKNSLKETFKLNYPDMKEKVINDNSNIVGSIILYYILNTKLEEQELYIYYIIDNIVNMEKLNIEDQIKLQNNLISLGEKYYK